MGFIEPDWPDTVSYNWTGVGHATDYVTMYYVADATDLLIDLITLSLPLPVIKQLHVNSRKKWLISGIFLLGALWVPLLLLSFSSCWWRDIWSACVSSAVRLYYLVQFTDPSLFEDGTCTFFFPLDPLLPHLIQVPDNVTYLIIWSSIEPNTSIIAACLPTLAPLVKDLSTQSIVRSFRYYYSLLSSYSLLGKSQKVDSVPTGSGSRSSSSARGDKFDCIADGTPVETSTKRGDLEACIEMGRVGS